jgi:hypothetical protein
VSGFHKKFRSFSFLNHGFSIWVIKFFPYISFYKHTLYIFYIFSISVVSQRPSQSAVKFLLAATHLGIDRVCHERSDSNHKYVRLATNWATSPPFFIVSFFLVPAARGRCQKRYIVIAITLNYVIAECFNIEEKYRSGLIGIVIPAYSYHLRCYRFLKLCFLQVSF